jgi:cell division septation protein DedD
LNENPKYGVRYKILNVFLVVVIAGAAAYYFYFKEPEPAKRVSQAQSDKKNKIHKPTVQAQKSAHGRQPEPDKKAATQPVAEPAALTASQTTAQPAHKAGTPSPAIKENKPVEPAQAVALIEKKQAQLAAEEKNVIAPHQQEAAVKTTMYCINVASCKLKESADAVIKDLQKKGYVPAVDTIAVKDITWYRVTLGHFQTQGEAQNYARELQGRENIKGFVVKKKY